MRVSSFVPSEEIFQSNKDTKTDKKVNSGLEAFSSTLEKSLQGINDQQITADKMGTAFAKGEDVQISDVMLAGEEAKISLQFAVQVRNKLLDAYKEINQMQL
ncbi:MULTISPECIES: flagellar hook-basal body complex protein FliE [Clostridium]|uniref:Flagellar hook-basal body complex protein FliE n=1 Tax=Clostridium cibarium TaxID=2762247 RepID=A0ABR8PNU6_9CLOT|nr:MULTISPECIES: flagellar hook-basal body complex protein FliE [Clostridium]MBD7909846.1 flagellar hook-basal body complex protein FliE [Clostridium cibarium]